MASGITLTPLENQARRFSDRISQTVSEFLGEPVEFSLAISGDNFVLDHRDHPIQVKINDRIVLSLKVTYRGSLDTRGHYIKVRESYVKVGSAARF